MSEEMREYVRRSDGAPARARQLDRLVQVPREDVTEEGVPGDWLVIEGEGVEESQRILTPSMFAAQFEDPNAVQELPELPADQATELAELADEVTSDAESEDVKAGLAMGSGDPSTPEPAGDQEEEPSSGGDSPPEPTPADDSEGEPQPGEGEGADQASSEPQE